MEKKKGKRGAPLGVRYGGRKPGSVNKLTRTAREICEQLGCHPAEFLAMVCQKGVMPNADGTFTTVDAAMRLDAAKALAPYVMPKLAQTTLTGPNDGPVQVAAFDVAALLADPEAARAAQALALKLVYPSSQPATKLLYDGQ